MARVSDAGVWEWAVSGGGPDTDVAGGISVAADGSIGLTGTVKFPANGDGSYGAVQFGSIVLTCGGRSASYNYFGECGRGNPFSADVNSSGEWVRATFTETYSVSRFRSMSGPGTRIRSTCCPASPIRSPCYLPA